MTSLRNIQHQRAPPTQRCKKPALHEPPFLEVHLRRGFEQLLLGRLLSAMLLKKYLVLSSAVLQAQMLLYQSPQFQFVPLGKAAQIGCTSSENYYNGGTSVVWYKARENERPLLIKSCSEENNAGRFLCKVESQTLVLEILDVRMDDSGIFLCAQDRRFGSLAFSNGSSSLLVGDSFSPSTRVMLLLPPPHLAHAGHVACMVHGVSNLVQVSWEVHGGLEQEGLALMVRNRSGLLTFASVLRIPRDPQGGGKNFTCKVRFNSSGPGVKESAIFPPASSVDSEGKCWLWSYVLAMAVVVLLTSLIFILSCLWIRLGSSSLGRPLLRPAGFPGKDF